jgi:hypothetical protein
VLACCHLLLLAAAAIAAAEEGLPIPDLIRGTFDHPRAFWDRGARLTSSAR